MLAVMAVGTFICMIIIQRKVALLTVILWYLVYCAIRVVEFGEYGGAGYALGAKEYYWGSFIIPIIILGIGIASVLSAD